MLCFGCITISFNVAAIAAAIPAISSGLRLPDLLISKIIPFYMIPYGLGALMYAPMTKRISYRSILAYSLALYAFASFFSGIANTANQLFIGRFFSGITAGGVIPLGLILIGQLFKKEIRGRLVGIFFGCSFVASIAGILISGLADWRWLFFIPALLAAFTSLCIVLYKSELLKGVHGVRVNYIKVFNAPLIQKVFVFIFAISFLYHGVHKWFGIYLDRIYGLDKMVISVFFVVMAAGGFAGQNIGGWISDKRGRSTACMIGLLILAIATMLLFQRYSLPVLALVLGLLGMGWTIGHNGISTVLTDFPPQHRPAIASLNSSVRFVSGGIGFYVSRLFVEKSFEMTFLGFGILMLILALFVKSIVPEYQREDV